jgi:hypothetical protein
MDEHDDHEQDSAPPPAAVAGLEAVTAAFAAADDVGQVAMRLGSTAIVSARCAEAVLPLVVAALHARRADADRPALSVVVADDDRHAAGIARTLELARAGVESVDLPAGARRLLRDDDRAHSPTAR